MRKLSVLLLVLFAFNCEDDCTQEAKKIYLSGKSQSWTLCLNGQTKTYSSYNAYINVLNNNPNATDGACETLSNGGINTSEENVEVPCDIELPSDIFTDENYNQYQYKEI